MTRDQAILKATHFAHLHGVNLEELQLLHAEIITEESSVISKFPDHFKSKVGWWRLCFKPVGMFGGDEQFLICDRSGTVDWTHKPFWFRLLLRLNTFFRKKANKASHGNVDPSN